MAKTNSSLLLCWVFFLGCRENQPLREITPEHIVRKFNYAVGEKDSWKAEVWMNVLGQSIDAPIHIWVRLTPKEETAFLPKVEVSFSIQEKKGGDLRERKLELVFEDCSKKPRDKESIFKDEVGARPEFPPKEKCWQANIPDLFMRGRREKGIPLEKGFYVIKGEIVLEKGARIPIELPTIKMFKGRGMRPEDQP